MIKIWRNQTEGAIQQDLASGGLEEIVASDYFCDLHGGIVHDHSQLIRGKAIMAPDYEIAEIPAGNEFLRTVETIREANGFAIGNVETPIDI
jgi:hypothetical protein